jgi:hypothetical protein
LKNGFARGLKPRDHPPPLSERLVSADQSADEELEALALEGLNSGDPIEVGPGYREEKHRRLDERLKKTGAR